MADLTITAGSVIAGTGAQISDGYAASAITAGQLLYVNTSSLLAPAQANGATTDEIAGVALNSAGTGQPVRFQHAGRYTVGATVAVGVYVLSAAGAGGIAPEADLATGHYLSVWGSAVSTTVIEIKIHNTGATHA